MSPPEQPYLPMPVNDDVIFKLIEDTTIGVSGGELLIPRPNPFISTKEFVDKLARIFLNMLYPGQIFKEGIKAKVLEPGKKWVAGTIRLRLVVEFSPDEPEDNRTSDKFVSQLDDIRNINL